MDFLISFESNLTEELKKRRPQKYRGPRRPTTGSLHRSYKKMVSVSFLATHFHGTLRARPPGDISPTPATSSGQKTRWYLKVLRNKFLKLFSSEDVDKTSFDFGVNFDRDRKNWRSTE